MATFTLAPSITWPSRAATAAAACATGNGINNGTRWCLVFFARLFLGLHVDETETHIQFAGGDCTVLAKGRHDCAFRVWIETVSQVSDVADKTREEGA